jgi:hypothetical protein
MDNPILDVLAADVVRVNMMASIRSTRKANALLTHALRISLSDGQAERVCTPLISLIEAVPDPFFKVYYSSSTCTSVRVSANALRVREVQNLHSAGWALQSRQVGQLQPCVKLCRHQTFVNALCLPVDEFFSQSVPECPSVITSWGGTATRLCRQICAEALTTLCSPDAPAQPNRFGMQDFTALEACAECGVMSNMLSHPHAKSNIHPLQ